MKRGVQFVFLLMVLLLYGAVAIAQDGTPCTSSFGVVPGAASDTNAELCGSPSAYTTTTTSAVTNCASGAISSTTISLTSIANFDSTGGSAAICNTTGVCNNFTYTEIPGGGLVMNGIANSANGGLTTCTGNFASGSRVYTMTTATNLAQRLRILMSGLQSAQKFVGQVATTCAGATVDGQGCWNTTSDLFSIGDGAALKVLASGDASGNALKANVVDNLTQVTIRNIADTTGILAVARGGTAADLSTTGGANQFVKQSSVGGAFSVGVLADADVPNALTLSTKALDAKQDCGAVGDGVADDRTSLQNCLNGTTNPDLRPVFFSAGTYLVSNSGSGYYLQNQGVDMIGAGWEKSKIRTATGATAVPALLIAQTTGRRGLKISGMEFGRTTQASAGGAGIEIDTSIAGAIVILEGLRVKGGDTTDNDIGIDVQNVSGLTIRDSFIDGNTYGIKVVKTAGAFIGEVYIENSVIHSNDTAAATNAGIRYEGVSGANLLDAAIRITNGHVSGCGGGDAFFIKWAQNIWIDKTVLESGCSVWSNQIHIEQSSEFHITDNTHSGGGSSPGTLIEVALAAGGGSAEIIGNRFGGTYGGCIDFGGSGWDNIIIADNRCHHAGGAPTVDLTGTGIKITDATASFGVILGNIVRRFATGLDINAGATNFFALANLMSDNTTPFAAAAYYDNHPSPFVVGPPEAPVVLGTVRTFDPVLAGYTARDGDSDVESFMGAADNNKVIMGSMTAHNVHLRVNNTGTFGFQTGTYFAGPRNLAAATANTLCYSATALDAITYNLLATCSSSRRYKEDVRLLDVDKGKVLALQPVEFKWKGREERGVGLIAEEVELLIPELTTYKEGQVEGVRYGELTVYLLEIIKEQEKRLTELEAQQRR